MRICVTVTGEGGLEGRLEHPLEESEIFDYYDISEDGEIRHTAQLRKCLGGCEDPAESIVRRRADAVIVSGLSPSSLLKLLEGGVRVYRAASGPARASIQAFRKGELSEITMEDFPKLARK